ncbi:MAG: FAD-dependent oxidoreductase [Treponema sp.]|nr:FAD-dependent oxidoreductase [Treponema sp.]
MQVHDWPYPNEFGTEEVIDSEVLVLGGGLAGCFAAIAAARRGKKVTLVEKKRAPSSVAAPRGVALTIGNPAVPIPVPGLRQRKLPRPISANRTTTATALVITLSAAKATTSFWIWSPSAARSATPKVSFGGPNSGMLKPDLCSPMITKTNLPCGYGVQPLSPRFTVSSSG